MRIIVVLMITVLFSYLSTLVPTPTGVPNWYAFHIPFILYVIFTTFHVAAATFFLLGLQGFTSTFKRAYIFVALGVVAVGLAQLAISILQALYLWSSPFAAWSGTILPYLAGAMLILIGITRLAKLLNIKTNFAALKLIIPLAVVIGVLALILPHSANTTTGGVTEIQYRWRVMILMETMVLNFAAAGIAWRIAQTIGAFYQKSARWLFIAFTGTTVAAVQASFFAFVGYDNFYITSGLFSLVYIVVAVFYLRAGLVFRRMTHERRTGTTGFNSVDLIVYAAGLVSTPQRIESVLDKLRAITASQSSDKELTAAQQKTLMNVYLDIESYLAASELVHPYTKEQLRTKMAQAFDFDNNKVTTLWNSLPS